MRTHYIHDKDDTIRFMADEHDGEFSLFAFNKEGKVVGRIYSHNRIVEDEKARIENESQQEAVREEQEALGRGTIEAPKDCQGMGSSNQTGWFSRGPAGFIGKAK